MDEFPFEAQKHLIFFTLYFLQPAHIYLLEDGLELWQAVISNAPTLNPDLLTLYNNLFALLERASETLETCLAITRSYILIDSQNFLQVSFVKNIIEKSSFNILVKI